MSGASAEIAEMRAAIWWSEEGRTGKILLLAGSNTQAGRELTAAPRYASP
jgi:hypothetical protein